MDRILITGATGFVGRALVARLASARHALILATRSDQPVAALPGDSLQIVVGDIGPQTDWKTALQGCAVVVHLAARTPGRGVSERDFERVNNSGTARLCEQAAQSGIRLFINLSSLHAVSSDGTESRVDDHTIPHPNSAYGWSKRAGEGHVAGLASAGIAAVSLRPPLVTGAQASGGWRLLQRLAASGVPLPFGGLTTLRSLISVENLVDAIATIIASDDRGASADAFFVADREPTNLRDIVELLRQGMGLPRRIFAMPQPHLSIALLPFGHSLSASFLGGTVVDGTGFATAYSWQAPVSTAQGIIESGRRFIQNR